MSSGGQGVQWEEVLYSNLHALNTATGVLVSRVNRSSTPVFIPGEHWDPDKGEFVAIDQVHPSVLYGLAISWQIRADDDEGETYETRDVLAKCASELKGQLL